MAAGPEGGAFAAPAYGGTGTGAPDGPSAQITSGAAQVVVTGEPTELLCWAFGRESVADVTVETQDLPDRPRRGWRCEQAERAVRRPAAFALGPRGRWESARFSISVRSVDVAKSPGWYKDPWGGQGKRYWDGQGWTQNYVDDSSGQTWLPANAGVAMRQPLATAARIRPWWQAWWFIGLMLFLVCWPVGLILIWTRDSTRRGSSWPRPSRPWSATSCSAWCSSRTAGLYPAYR